jgi:hypothetical protein
MKFFLPKHHNNLGPKFFHTTTIHVALLIWFPLKGDDTSNQTRYVMMSSATLSGTLTVEFNGGKPTT